jgi:hypothetical protein
LDTQAGDDIAVFVVWSDQLGAAPHHVRDAAELMRDSRAHHYWDGDELIGRGYPTLDLDGTTIKLSGPAWDFWLLFDHDAEWTPNGPPKPTWWEHQIRGGPPERRLDPARFARKAAALRRRQ